MLAEKQVVGMQAPCGVNAARTFAMDAQIEYHEEWNGPRDVDRMLPRLMLPPIPASLAKLLVIACSVTTGVL